MKLSGWGKAQSADGGEPAEDNSAQCMTALVEGVAEAMPRIDPTTYSQFRGTAARMAMQIPDSMDNAERLKVVNAILHEFENYRHGVEEELRDRQKNWRSLTIKLTQALLDSLGVKADSSLAQPLTDGVDQLVTAEQVREYRELLITFLEQRSAHEEVEKTSPLKAADTSTSNTNASGLPGGGAAVEHLRKVMERGVNGFVVVFHLSCLELVSKRFGPEAVDDCLMAVSAYLTSSLHSDDAIFHWSDSSLVAILLGRPNDHILTAELHRIAVKNTDINVTIGDRSIMLRIPFSFDLHPIDRFKTAEELYKLTLQGAKR